MDTDPASRKKVVTPLAGNDAPAGKDVTAVLSYAKLQYMGFGRQTQFRPKKDEAHDG
jgi:hypothetical protein